MPEWQEVLYQNSAKVSHLKQVLGMSLPYNEGRFPNISLLPLFAHPSTDDKQWKTTTLLFVA